MQVSHSVVTNTFACSEHVAERTTSVVWRQWLRWRVHLDFKEGRSEGRPLVDDLQKHQFGFLPRFA